MRHHAAYRPGWDWSYAGELMRKLEIDEERVFGTLSKGQARRVELVMALGHRPPLLLLDEPTDGLDPMMRDIVLRLLRSHIRESSPTTIVATHVLHEVDALVDHVAVLHEGRLVLQCSRGLLERSLWVIRADSVASGIPRGLEARVIHSRPDGDSFLHILWSEPGDPELVREGDRSIPIEPATLTLEEMVVAFLHNVSNGRDVQS